MLRKFIVKYVGGKYKDSIDEIIELEDKESTICGYVSWTLQNSSANSIYLYRMGMDNLRLVAVAERKVLVTMRVPYADYITKLI